MAGFIEEAVAGALRGLTVAGMLWEIGEEARREDALALVRRSNAAIKMERGPSASQPDRFGLLFSRRQAFRSQDQVGLIARSHRDRRKDGARLGDEGKALGALLMFVARVATAIAPFVAPGVVPSPWSTVRSRCFSAARGRTLATHACQSDPASAH